MASSTPWNRAYRALCVVYAIGRDVVTLQDIIEDLIWKIDETLVAEVEHHERRGEGILQAHERLDVLPLLRACNWDLLLCRQRIASNMRQHMLTSDGSQVEARDLEDLQLALYIAGKCSSSRSYVSNLP